MNGIDGNGAVRIRIAPRVRRCCIVNGQYLNDLLVGQICPIDHLFQIDEIAKGQPISGIAEAVRLKALEIFADERHMRGMKLEEDLGL